MRRLIPFILLSTLPAFSAEKGQLSERTEADILRTVRLPEGYAATVFSRPPQGGYPTSVSAAIDGTLFVAIDENGSLGRDRNPAPGVEGPKDGRLPGKVVRMRDVDGDGRADEFKVFAEMESPRGVIWDGNGIDPGTGRMPGTLYVMYPPKLAAYRDADGDGKSDSVDVLVNGLGFGLDFRGADHTTNGARLAIDGFIYVAVGDYGFTKAVAKDGTTLSMRGGGIVRVRPDGTGFEIVSRGQRNIYDVAVSPRLDLFTRDNTNDGGGWNVRLSFVPPGAHMGYPYLFKNFPEDMFQPLADYGGGSPCGALWMDEPGLPKGLFTVEWGRNAIMQHALKSKGAGWEVAQEGTDPKSPGQSEWIKLTRPTDMDVDATGAVYITSWEGATFNYNGPFAGYVLRVVKKDAEKVTVPNLAKLTPADLAELVKRPSAVLRQAAVREIVRRQAPNGIPAEEWVIPLHALTASNAPLEVRIAALYAAIQAKARPSVALESLLKSGESAAAALRAIGDYPAALDAAGREQVISALGAPDPRTRAAAITALRRLRLAEAAPFILPLVADSDAVIAHLAVRALAELKAIESCLAALDSAESKIHPGALRALYGIHQRAVVDGLVSRLDGARGELRRGILNALCRLASQDAPYEDPKVWWGTRPDTSGPFYQPIPWSESDKVVAALKSALEKSTGGDAAWLIQRMYQTKVNFPGLVELMLRTAGNDTPAKLAAVEGMVRADKSLPAEAVAVLQGIATNAKELPELRLRALRLFTANVEHGSVFPGAVSAYAPLAGHDLGDAKLTAAFEEFTRGAHNGKWVGDYDKLLAGSDSPKRQLAATVLVNISTSRVGRENDRESARKAVERGFKKPESASALLTAIARAGAAPYAAQVKTHLNHPNNTVAEAALFAFQKLELKEGAARAKTIGEMKYEEVVAAVQKGGDPKAGSEMFLKAGCIACHTVNADEPAKGPILTAVARIYDRAALIESLLKPSAKLAQGFESTWIKTKKGEQLEGFVTREGGDNLDLRNIAGQVVLVEKADIAERGHRDVSMMPEGLLNAFTPAELANLLAWMESLKK